MDISRPCQPEKLIPLLPWPGFDPSFSGHNDEQSSASGHDYASDRSAIGAGYWRLCNNRFDFDFIECFTTTFLRAHSWLNWVDEDDDEDEVGLKEKPEDTRYIKKIT